MGKGNNWKRFATNRLLKKNKDYEMHAKLVVDRKYAPYRNGEFYIGLRLAEKWDPRKLTYPGDGLFFNRLTGNFEIWKDAKKLSSMRWKSNWKVLATWAEKLGVKTA